MGFVLFIVERDVIYDWYESKMCNFFQYQTHDRPPIIGLFMWLLFASMLYTILFILYIDSLNDD